MQMKRMADTCLCWAVLPATVNWGCAGGRRQLSALGPPGTRCDPQVPSSPTAMGSAWQQRGEEGGMKYQAPEKLVHHTTDCHVLWREQVS